MSLTLHATLADRLRALITSGEYAAGNLLPSETELAAQYEVSRSTVRQAINALVIDGLITSRPGVGHLVRATTTIVWQASDPERNTTTDGPGPQDSWSRSVRDQGHLPTEALSVLIEWPDRRVAECLRLGPQDPVVVRRRLRSVDGSPYSTSDSYYPQAIVAGTEIERPGDILPGVYAVFERLGRRWVSTVDRWTFRPPTRDETAQLRIARGVPVAEMARVSSDVDGTPVRLTLSVVPGDRHVIEYTHPEGARS